MAFLRPILIYQLFMDISADADISKIFKSVFLLHYQKYDVFYALPFFKN